MGSDGCGFRCEGDLSYVSRVPRLPKSQKAGHKPGCEARPGSLADISTMPPVKQNLFHVCKETERAYDESWRGVEGRGSQGRSPMGGVTWDAKGVPGGSLWVQ